MSIVKKGIDSLSGASDVQKTADRAREDTKKSLARALKELSPENIAQLAQIFLPEILAAGNPQFQSQNQALLGSQFSRGLGESEFGLTQEAGLRASQINNALLQSFGQGQALAGQRAGLESTIVGPGFGQAAAIQASKPSLQSALDPKFAGAAQAARSGGNQRQGVQAQDFGSNFSSSPQGGIGQGGGFQVK